MGTLRASKLEVTGKYSPGLLGPQVCQDERRGEQSVWVGETLDLFTREEGAEFLLRPLPPATSGSATTPARRQGDPLVSTMT